MLEIKREWSRLDVYPFSHSENGLESDAFLANEALDVMLGALTNVANSADIICRKTIFV
jgi:hypothetical protein